MNSKPVVPSSLQSEGLQPVWQAVRKILDRHGPERRGSIALPAIGDNARLVLFSLLGSKPRTRLDLTILENALITQGLGVDLNDALSQLGTPPSTAAAEKRYRKRTRQETRLVVTDTLGKWQEHWAQDYGEWLFRSGQMVNADANTAKDLLEQIRCLLNTIASTGVESDVGEILSRTELAVSLFGSSHALDDGVLLERCARRALWLQTDDKSLDYQRGRDVWAAAGVQTDRVSAPVLVWRLPLKSDSALGAITAAANEANVPVHLTEIALSTHPLEFEGQSQVFVVENPRLVEFAVEQRLSECVISTHGNPSTAVIVLIDALITAGITVNVHADFDTAGIGICRRLVERGCQSWCMTATDYQRAVRHAETRGLQLPIEPSYCGPTPWDTALEHSFEKYRAVVHEELIIDELLGDEVQITGITHT